MIATRALLDAGPDLIFRQRLEFTACIPLPVGHAGTPISANANSMTPTARNTAVLID
jgi:hypothetical protein